MTHSYISGGALGQSLRRMGLTALLAGGTALAAQAQGYQASAATNVTGTYTDLGTNGNAIATANTDDANSTAQDIGFSFTFNGTAFTQFILNTNGVMRLGSAAPSSALAASPYAQAPETGIINSTNAADVNLIMPFSFDLTAGTSTPEYRVYTTGTTGSRICTIQWKNVSDKAVAASASTATTVATQYTNFSFQVKLYEGTNLIEFVYNVPTVGTPDALKYATVGLKGSGNAAGQDILAVKASAAAWSSTTFTTGPQGTAALTNAHNFRGTFAPDAGRTYRFTQAIANDAGVTVYTLGKLPSAALPHSVQALVTNNGSTPFTNLVVTLNVTGANTISNTQTIASLPVGGSATVNFTAFPTTLATGTNTVTVTIPADANNANNSSAVQQTVNRTGTFSYVPTDQTSTPGNFVVGSAATGGIYATQYTTAVAATVTSVNVYLSDAGATTTSSTSVGKTVYAVVLSPTGTILGQSANYVIQTNDIGFYHTFAITTPPAVAAGGSFLAGLAQPAVSGLRFYPLAIQTESPTRSNTYFTAPLTGGTPTDLAASNSSFGRLMMEATVNTVLATSKELQRAITIYPNPSESGIFNLAVRNANAKGTLGVEVTDQLGRRVYTGSANDNFTTKVDLSNLAGGLYHLQVRNGEEFTSQQISIVK